MRKILFQLSVITIVLFSAMDTYCQNATNIETIDTNNFSSEFLLNGKTGKIFSINTNDSLSNVFVRWNNGYFAIGTTLRGKAFGKWFLYDKKNRLREYLIFGFDAKCILYSRKMDKQGEIISEIKAMTPCF